uniref:LOW QUALITY PROTEIN: uncharacterized protein LOC111111742 n=1 Tax=Crassostrea virginica TaxID=6565 RepID=A0A8B8BMM2_CRAVI|nr:LOW QUALITY PROTEIN: uncharacterized protein LOC111111742 [Crassostrea virginica]
MEGLIKLLSEIQITARGNRQAGNDLLLSLMSSPVIKLSCTVTGVHKCEHITCGILDQAWISDRYNLFLADKATGYNVTRVEDLSCYSWGGIHTVNNELELFYINKNFNANKLSKNTNTAKTFIRNTDSTWRARCLYFSPSTGDLLVGMYSHDTITGKVVRYTNNGQLTQTTPNKNTSHTLYRDPTYITENINGNVVVSDYYCRAVVVTSSEGTHRFSYTGPPSGPELDPRGVCTDALSHILVCDYNTATVQMLNRDGQFLCNILVFQSLSLTIPWSLSYDTHTHRLVVVTGSKTVYVYRYIERHTSLIDMNRISCTNWKMQLGNIYIASCKYNH